MAVISSDSPQMMLKIDKTNPIKNKRAILYK